MILFELNHKILNGDTLVTIHNGIFCISDLKFNGITKRKWWVRNPFNDVVTVHLGELKITLKYRFFPVIVVHMSINDGDFTIQKYPMQSIKLYGIGLVGVFLGVLLIYLCNQ